MNGGCCHSGLLGSAALTPAQPSQDHAALTRMEHGDAAELGAGLAGADELEKQTARDPRRGLSVLEQPHRNRVSIGGERWGGRRLDVHVG